MIGLIAAIAWYANSIHPPQSPEFCFASAVAWNDLGKTPRIRTKLVVSQMLPLFLKT